MAARRLPCYAGARTFFSIPHSIPPVCRHFLGGTTAVETVLLLAAQSSKRIQMLNDLTWAGIFWLAFWLTGVVLLSAAFWRKALSWITMFVRELRKELRKID